MISVNITQYDDEIVRIELTRKQAELLCNLCGKIGGGKDNLTICHPEQLDGTLIRDLVTDRLYQNLTEQLLFT